MSTVTTIGVVDLLTIRECIEILVDRRTGRDRTASLPPAVVDYLGAHPPSSPFQQHPADELQAPFWT